MGIFSMIGRQAVRDLLRTSDEAVVGLWFWLVRNLINSRMGRALRTVRDNEAAAATFGVSVRYAKAGSLAISSAMAGTAGALQAILNPYVGFSDFDAFLSLRLYAAAVIGGLGTLVGAVYGVIALIVVPAVNDALDLLASAWPDGSSRS